MQSLSKISFQVSAPGKVILFGEHSVVYGKTALAATLGQRTSLRFTTSSDNNNAKIRLSLPMIGIDRSFPLEDIKQFLALPFKTGEDGFNFKTPDVTLAAAVTDEVRDFLKRFDDGVLISHGQQCALIAFLFLIRGILGSVRFEVSSFLVEVTSELTIGAGTGSSASYGVCLAAALYQYLRCRVKHGGINNNISKDGFVKAEILTSDLTVFSDNEVDVILRWALLSDGIMHGNPSGIDATVITQGGMIEFRRGEGSIQIPRVPPMNFLLVNTRVSRDTKRLVAQVADLRCRLPEIVNPILEAMDHVALSAKQILTVLEPHDMQEKGKADFITKLGELMTLNQSLLSAVTVSHPSLDNICFIAQRHNLAAKLTGAGGGGYAIILLPDRLETGAQALKTELISAGYEPVMAVMGGPGVQLVTG